LILRRPGLEEAAEGGDVFTLARGFRGPRLSGLHFAPTLGHRARIGPIPDLVERAHGDPPVRHGARGVCRDDFLELRPRFLVPEIMEQRDAAVEARAHRGRAGDLERHRSQMLIVDCGAPRILSARARHQQ